MTDTLSPSAMAAHLNSVGRINTFEFIIIAFKTVDVKKIIFLLTNLLYRLS